MFGAYPAGEPFDLAVALADLVQARRLAAHAVHERFHDIGNPQSYEDTTRWVAGTADDA